jgi:hypothetical protein
MHKRYQPSSFKSQQAMIEKVIAEETWPGMDSRGRRAYSGYSQAILDLLKDPVSLGTQGANSHGGRQR